MDITNSAGLNRAQLVCLRTYGDGVFDHLREADTPEAFAKSLDETGDDLLKFMMSELSSTQECDGMGTAISRAEMAISDLQAISTALMESQFADDDKPFTETEPLAEASAG